MPILYDLGIRAYLSGLRAAALFNEKARQWVEGRKDWPNRLERAMGPLHKKQAPIAWIHCASLGEFEQGRPLIESLKDTYPDLQVVLSFFSPSGYLIRKEYPLADHVCYLPGDTPRNASRFLDILQPDLVIFVKYEFWYHHLKEVQRRGLPLLLISALFRPGQWLFRQGGAAFRELLAGFSHIFVQNKASAAQLQKLELDNFSLSGDTRIDRVCDIAARSEAFPIVAAFAGESPVLVAGSTWPPDEALLSEFIRRHLPDDWKLIVAPHQIGESHLQALQSGLPLPALRYSEATIEEAARHRVLLIDNVGMLSGLYRYGRLAYIGGGFGAGIHNILEPIAFGLPVLFGPKYRKFEEAVQLVRRGGGFSVAGTEEFTQVFQKLDIPDHWEAAKDEALGYLQESRGATRSIMQYIYENRLVPIDPDF